MSSILLAALVVAMVAMGRLAVRVILDSAASFVADETRHATPPATRHATRHARRGFRR